LHLVGFSCELGLYIFESAWLPQFLAIDIWFLIFFCKNILLRCTTMYL